MTETSEIEGDTTDSEGTPRLDLQSPLKASTTHLTKKTKQSNAGENAPSAICASKTKRILLLMSHTGGGHKASAEALREGLLEVSTISLEIAIVDIFVEHGKWPFTHIDAVYRYACENAWAWKILFDSTKSFTGQQLFLHATYAVCRQPFAEFLTAFNPDLIISVHPLAQFAPLMILRGNETTTNPSAPKVAQDTFRAEPSSPYDRVRKHPAFVTVVTDLGGAHPTWFHPLADTVYVPTERLRQAALRQALAPARIRVIGLPLRRHFWKSSISLAPSLTPSHNPSLAPSLTPSLNPSLAPSLTPSLNPSLTPSLAPSLEEPPAPSAVAEGREGRAREARERLGLKEDLRTVLLLCGSEGFNLLVRSTLTLLDTLRTNTQIILICGAAKPAAVAARLCAATFPKNSSSNASVHFLDPTLAPAWETMEAGVDTEVSAHSTHSKNSHWFQIYEFYERIDLLMEASDLLVTKAGPGSIAEAMSKGLPVCLSSFLPGQEEGNVQFVLDTGCGTYIPDAQERAVVVDAWLHDHRYKEKLETMQRRALEAVDPRAALSIARDLLRSFLSEPDRT